MEAHIDSVGLIAQNIAGAPSLGFVVAGVGVAVGLVLWLRGRGLMRCLAALLGAILFGSACGALILATMGAPGGGAVQPWHGFLLGGVLGGAAGAFAYRWMLAIACGLLVCATTVAGAWMWSDAHRPGATGEASRLALDDHAAVKGGSAGQARTSARTGDPPEDAAMWTLLEHVSKDPAGAGSMGRGLQTGRVSDSARAGASKGLVEQVRSVFGQGHLEGDPLMDVSRRASVQGAMGLSQTAGESDVPEAADQTPEVLRPVVEQARVVLGPAIAQGRARWGGLPRSTQATIITAGALGLAVGTLMGVWAASFAATVLSSLIGAATWLGAGVWLSLAMGAPWCGSLERSPVEWAGIVLIATIAGAIVQCWTMRRGPAAGATPKSA